MLLTCMTLLMTITSILLRGLVIDPHDAELLCGLVIGPHIDELLRGLVIDPHVAELLRGLVIDPCIAEYLRNLAHDPCIDDPLRALLVKYLQCIIGTLKTFIKLTCLLLLSCLYPCSSSHGAALVETNKLPLILGVAFLAGSSTCENRWQGFEGIEPSEC
jgi:hypothetical protein